MQCILIMHRHDTRVAINRLACAEPTLTHKDACTHSRRTHGMNTLPVNITAATRTTTAYRYRISLALSALCLPALISISGASSAATAYLGWVTDSTTDPYVNRCAINAASSISTLPTNPNYVMAYRSGADSCSSYAPTTGYGMIHRQGIQRLTRDGQNYLLVTMSTKNGTPDSTGAGFRTAWVDLWRVDLNASYVPTLHVHAGRVQRSQARTKCALARANQSLPRLIRGQHIPVLRQR